MICMLKLRVYHINFLSPLMMSWHANIFHIVGPLWGGALIFFFVVHPIKLRNKQLSIMTNGGEKIQKAFVKATSLSLTWWRHQMETFSALLALCAGNSPVPVNSLHKGQWRRALVFSFICAWINDWVNNREAGDLRRQRGHYNVNVMNVIKWNESSPKIEDIMTNGGEKIQKAFVKATSLSLTWWRHQMETFSALLALCAGNSPVPVNSLHKGQ